MVATSGGKEFQDRYCMPRVCTGEFHDAGFSGRIFRKPVTDCFIERLYECGACHHKQFKILAIQSHASNWDKKI